MALIQCPECNKEISDKAAACPNCGCPISSTTAPTYPNYMLKIKGQMYDVRRVANLMKQGEKIPAIKELREMTGLLLSEAKTWVEGFDWSLIDTSSTTTISTIQCPACSKVVSINATNCPHCGQPISTALKCPRCNSTNIESISGLKKGASALAFGVFAANTVLSKYKCNKCGHKF